MDWQLTTDRGEALPAGDRRPRQQTAAKSAAATRRFASHGVAKRIGTQHTSITQATKRPSFLIKHSGSTLVTVDEQAGFPRITRSLQGQEKQSSRDPWLIL
jgi:hypothetical protein